MFVTDISRWPRSSRVHGEVFGRSSRPRRWSWSRR
jgi:hypothetical protein